jgi:hypothetical protein
MLLSTYVINPKTQNFGTIERQCFLIISKLKKSKELGCVFDTIGNISSIEINEIYFISFALKMMEILNFK